MTVVERSDGQGRGREALSDAKLHLLRLTNPGDHQEALKPLTAADDYRHLWHRIHAVMRSEKETGDAAHHPHHRHLPQVSREMGAVVDVVAIPTTGAD